MKSKLVDRKLKEAARKLNCTPEEIWEDLAAGYVDSIPSEEEILDDIEDYIKDN